LRCVSVFRNHAMKRLASSWRASGTWAEIDSPWPPRLATRRPSFPGTTAKPTWSPSFEWMPGKKAK